MPLDAVALIVINIQMQMAFIFRCNHKAGCMVTLFYFPTEKKNLRAHALWMTSLAVAKATPLRNEVPPV